jgi:hypothetical protein
MLIPARGATPPAPYAWGIDVGYAGTQKCLGVAPGLAPFTINDRAFERRVEKPQSWYLDLGMLGGYVGEAEGKGQRTYHHTAPVAMVASLHAGLTRVLEEGLDAVNARHHEAGQLLQKGLEEMGLELFAQEGARLPELTTVKVPEGVDSAAVRRELLERFDLEIGAGAGEYAASVWRIGLMGEASSRRNVLLFLAALERVGGRDEWGVKVYDAAPPSAPCPVPEPIGQPRTGPAARSGRAYLDRVRGRQLARASRQEAALRVSERVDAELRCLAVAARRLRPHSPEVTGDRRQQLLNAAYLVDTGRERELSARIESLRREPDIASGVSIEVTGPWVPYSFVDGGAADGEI